MDSSPIRETIRQVILPLVQAIYDEDPADMILFCSKYFENLLREREAGTGDQQDPKGEELAVNASETDNPESDAKSGDAKELPEEEEVKASNKTLSCEFIPLLDKDASLQEEYSETLQNLAHKFDSAENNLDVELQNAKEISDVVQGRRQQEESGHPADSRSVVDESWRKRWYDVHPRLDSRIRTRRIFTGGAHLTWLEDTDQPAEQEDTHRDGSETNKEENGEGVDSQAKECRDSKVVEPGLNSACGDFSNRPMQAITAEYVEGVIERLMQQQSLNDAYEGLYFSSYSESESSNVESDNGME